MLSIFNYVITNILHSPANDGGLEFCDRSYLRAK